METNEEKKVIDPVGARRLVSLCFPSEKQCLRTLRDLASAQPMTSIENSKPGSAKPQQTASSENVTFFLNQSFHPTVPEKHQGQEEIDQSIRTLSYQTQNIVCAGVCRKSRKENVEDSPSASPAATSVQEGSEAGRASSFSTGRNTKYEHSANAKRGETKQYALPTQILSSLFLVFTLPSMSRPRLDAPKHPLLEY